MTTYQSLFSQRFRTAINLRLHKLLLFEGGGHMLLAVGIWHQLFFILDDFCSDITQALTLWSINTLENTIFLWSIDYEVSK